MKIEIGEYIVEGDGVCVGLYEKRVSKKGKEYRREVGWYADFDQALRRLLNEKIAEVDKDSIKSILRAVKSAKEEITKSVNRIYCRGMVR